jgi:ribose 5-phosphate isomerase B
MKEKKIAIGCDEAAFDLKEGLKQHLEEKGYKVVDYGVAAGETILYPDAAFKVAEAVGNEEYERAILLCGTGLGVCMSANKVPGVRAAVCHDPYSAERARKSNNAQIACFGARVIGLELAKNLLDTWLDSEFQGGRSVPKVNRMIEYEQEVLKK